MQQRIVDVIQLELTNHKGRFSKYRFRELTLSKTQINFDLWLFKLEFSVEDIFLLPNMVYIYFGFMLVMWQLLRGGGNDMHKEDKLVFLLISI